MTKTKIDPKIITMTVVGLSVALMTVCSWISIPIGSVPVTLQTFAVFAIAGLFDLKTGMLTMLVYLLLGAVDVPVFSNFKSGITVLAGPTGGYIIGFVLSVLIVWGFKQIKVKPRLFLILGMITGLIVCYAFGTIWFYIKFANSGESKTILEILSICVIPFILPDTVKIAAAAILVDRLKLPLEKMGYNV